MEVDPDVDILNVHDLAEYLRLSEAKIYKLANEGQIPALRMGKVWRFKKDIIDEWIRQMTNQGLQAVNSLHN
jgi:excisionase family DNA binding protein